MVQEEEERPSPGPEWSLGVVFAGRGLSQGWSVAGRPGRSHGNREGGHCSASFLIGLKTNTDLSPQPRQLLICPPMTYSLDNPPPQPSRINRNIIKQEGLLLFPEDVDKLRSPQTSDKMSTCGFSSHNLGQV